MQKIDAEPDRAIYALSIAAELLQSAQDNASDSSFEEAIIQSRDSIRMASSAILFKDGFVATDLESSCTYLKKKYSKAIPVDEWRHVETLANSGPFDRLVGLFGIGKGRLEKNAKEALEAANRFLSASTFLLIE